MKRIFLVVSTVMLLVSCSEHPETDYNQVIINDLLAQYEILERSGDFMERCIQSGVIAHVYLEMLDEENFKKWKEIEKRMC